MNISKKILFSILFFLFISANFYSQEVQIFNKQENKSNSSQIIEESPFSLDLKRDCIISASALALNVLNLSLKNFAHIKTNVEIQTIPYPKNNVNPFDATFMKPYSHKLDRGGDIFLVSTALTSCVTTLLSPKDSLLTHTIMLGETFLLANGLKDSLKLLVNRARPYMYFENPPIKDLEDGDWTSSWPSGHTTLAFTAASFASYTFWKNYPDNPWRITITAVSFSLASATGICRIASGNHFITDVLSGAVLGTFCGFIVPFLHTLNTKNGNIKAFASPTGFNVCVNF